MIELETLKYQARVWRTDTLVEEAGKQVQIMLRAFIPEGYIVEIRRQDNPVPGFPYAQPYSFFGIVKDGRENGSDANFCAMGHTVEGTAARLLAIILEDGGFFPLT